MRASIGVKNRRREPLTDGKILSDARINTGTNSQARTGIGEY